MSTNQEIIKKADLALSDLATAGKLNPMQADTFIRNLIDQPTVLSQVRTVVMKGSQMKINKIGFGSRILHPAVESTALAANNRAKPDLSQVLLNTKEVIAEVRIPYDVLEDNIEGGNPLVAMQQGAGGMHQTIVELMGQRAALDLEELALLGDTASADAYLAMNDGYLKMATANAVTASTAISKDVIKAALKAMPTRFLRDRTSMKHFISVNNETDLRDIYANRIGAFGDTNLQNNTSLQMFGSAIEPVALMPQANSLFTNPLNLIFGIQRNISVEYDKDITSRVFIIVLTARIAFQIEEVNAVVKTSGIV